MYIYITKQGPKSSGYIENLSTWFSKGQLTQFTVRPSSLVAVEPSQVLVFHQRNRGPSRTQTYPSKKLQNLNPTIPKIMMSHEKK